MKKEAAEARALRLNAANRLIQNHVDPEQIAPKKRKAVRRAVAPALELRIEVAKVS